jgi:hypothetical protein
MKQDNKELIEKAFEKWAEKHKTGVESKRDEVTAKTAFIAGATWQIEQYRKTSEYFTANYCEQLLEENKLLKERFKKYQADNLLEREQLIKELREWVENNKLISKDEKETDFDALVLKVRTNTYDLLAKLDLLEGEK